MYRLIKIHARKWKREKRIYCTERRKKKLFKEEILKKKFIERNFLKTIIEGDENEFPTVLETNVQKRKNWIASLPPSTE